MFHEGAGRLMAVLLILPLFAAAAQGKGEAPGRLAESQSYTLRSAVAGSAGAPASSASYVINGTMGQPHPGGYLSGSAYAMYAGFWRTIVPTSTDAQDMPLAFRLSQNYPNPFNPVTTIGYSVAEKADVRLSIYDVAGRRVRTLISETQLPGGYSVVWDGRNDRGTVVAAGVYFYRLTAGGNTGVRKMIVLR